MGLELDLSPDPMPQAMTGSLRAVASTHTLRCDAKQFEPRHSRLDSYLDAVSGIPLGRFLPGPIVKGKQPNYAGDDAVEGIPVITTMAIRRLRIELDSCRLAETVDYGPGELRKPRLGDVLLTVDGGPSIGKPVLFDLDGDYAIDSHVAILRPVGLDPQLLVYLLASTLSQVQLRRFESGASGQTAINEEDIRRLRIPSFDPDHAAKATALLSRARAEVAKMEARAISLEASAWDGFMAELSSGE